ncbi:methionine adenosyltransferase [Streptomyces olivoreticuli]|uniref:methionine adenosyltransferase n=1 Tax=Streptomyces olivoreticuli TaxID=68246 RepID=UPI00265B2308|nr:methionine adenosyltransferase [Streptomyces olivoreticuli]WKK24240.1 methionine adenosyltransferase [Streptomyces olivoreticuli]
MDRSNLTYVPAAARRADEPFEIVERKGHGHPDTLADALGEHLSSVYCAYTREHFGAVLHHQFDKTGILGGRVQVAFGGGQMLAPVRILLSGRASGSFADEPIPVREMLTDATRAFFTRRFPMLDAARDLRLLYEVSRGDSPGGIGAKDTARNVRSRWFAPQSLDDLPERKKLACNDTSSGCAFSPPTPTEQLVLDIEEVLAGQQRPAWLGSDIKVMAHRHGSRVNLTCAVPQIAAHVPDLDAYITNREAVGAALEQHAAEHYPGLQVRIWLNTRDDDQRPELYLTHTGSSIETGDEGLVGRGNRYGGLIAAGRPFTMEGISGKNPVYHTGKVYCVGADLIARSIHDQLGHGAEVLLVGQSGRELTDPWAAVVRVEPGTDGSPAPDVESVAPLVDKALGILPGTIDDILTGTYRMH